VDVVVVAIFLVSALLAGLVYVAMGRTGAGAVLTVAATLFSFATLAALLWDAAQ
jgi:hypothetical protein